MAAGTALGSTAPRRASCWSVRTTIDGPCIVEQSDTTTVIEPDMALTVDMNGNMLVKVK